MNLRQYLRGRKGFITTLGAIHDGLLQQNRRNDFNIEMVHFGGYRNGVCFGCAAACAIQEITRKNFTQSNEIERLSDRADFLGVRADDLGLFEEAVDAARGGYFDPLASFCCLLSVDLNRANSLYDENQFYLTNFSWKKKLPILKRIIDVLMDEWGLEWDYISE